MDNKGLGFPDLPLPKESCCQSQQARSVEKERRRFSCFDSATEINGYWEEEYCKKTEIKQKKMKTNLHIYINFILLCTLPCQKELNGSLQSLVDSLNLATSVAQQPSHGASLDYRGSSDPPPGVARCQHPISCNPATRERNELHPTVIVPD